MNSYLITSREFYTDTPAVFRSILQEQIIKHSPTYALYRDKSNANYNTQAEHFVEVCSNFENLKSFIHQDVNLAKQLNATGVHLTSLQFDEIKDAKSKGLDVIISIHSHEEALKAQTLGADAVTYSPIFTSPGKGIPKGIDDLKELLNKCSVKVFALGGIVNYKEISEIEKTGAYGFASIRYFY